MSVHQINLPLGRDRESAPHRTRRVQSISGVKFPTAIVHGERWERDALIMLALDPRIATIERVEERVQRGLYLSIGVTLRDGSPVILRIVSDQNAKRWHETVPGVALMSRDAIMRSPGLEARRAVWTCREAYVSATNRYRVAAALETSPDGLPLRDIVGLVQGRSREVVDAVCALACEDVIAINLAGGLTPEAVVTRTPRTASEAMSFGAETGG